MSEVWHRRRDLGEPKGAYDAFTHFRDMPPGARSVDGAYRIHRKVCRNLPDRDGAAAPGIWRRWKLLYQWVDRVDAFDAHVEEQSLRERRESIRQMNDRQSAISTAIQAKTIERLQSIKPEDIARMSLLQVAQVLEKAAQVERRARGQATDIVRHQHEQQPADYNRLNPEELELLERLHAKAYGEAE